MRKTGVAEGLYTYAEFGVCLVAFLPVILASGVVLRERDTGALAMLAAKPITMPRYFVVRTLSACATRGATASHTPR